MVSQRVVQSSFQRFMKSFFILQVTSIRLATAELSLPFSFCLLPRFGSRSLSSAMSSANMASGRIQESPSAERNKGPIMDVLRSPEVLSAISRPGRTLEALEIAAGCGVHTLHFVREIIEDGVTDVVWHPTDPSQSIDSINARIEMESDPRVKNSIMMARLLTLDEDGVVEGRDGEIHPPTAGMDGIDLMVNINMIHISPLEATTGLMKTASKLLRPGGILFCYGPYKVDGTAVESNLSFDRSLKSRDPSWGLRDLEEVVEKAEKNGLKLVKTVEMPANNLSVIYKKQ